MGYFALAVVFGLLMIFAEALPTRGRTPLSGAEVLLDSAAVSGLLIAMGALNVVAAHGIGRGRGWGWILSLVAALIALPTVAWLPFSLVIIGGLSTKSVRLACFPSANARGS